MTNAKPNQSSDKKSGTRFIYLTRYDVEAGTDQQSGDATDTLKNFPTTFIPMEELKDLAD